MDIITMAATAISALSAFGAVICKIMTQVRLGRRDKLDAALLFYLADKAVPRDVLRTVAEIRKPETRSAPARRLGTANE